MKLLRNLLSLAVMVCLLSACGSTVAGTRSADTTGFWVKNMRGKWAVVKRDMTNFYRTTDRHLFNYDWNDPYID